MRRVMATHDISAVRLKVPNSPDIDAVEVALAQDAAEFTYGLPSFGFAKTGPSGSSLLLTLTPSGRAAAERRFQ
jgi:hypothetical protein